LFQRFVKLGLGLPDAQSADGVAVEIHVPQLLGAPAPQLRDDAALGDGPEMRPGFPFPKSFAGPAGPPDRRLHGLPDLGFGGGERDEMIKDHHDVRAEKRLDVHNVLGRQEQLRAVQVGGEGHPIAADLGQRFQAVNLETAAVGQNGLGPGDEGMQPAHRPDGFGSGAEEQVVGITEDQVGSEGRDLVMGQALDRALAGDGGESRRRDVSVGRPDYSSPGRGAGGRCFDDEAFFHERDQYKIYIRMGGSIPDSPSKAKRPVRDTAPGSAALSAGVLFTPCSSPCLRRASCRLTGLLSGMSASAQGDIFVRPLRGT